MILNYLWKTFCGKDYSRAPKSEHVRISDVQLLSQFQTDFSNWMSKNQTKRSVFRHFWASENRMTTIGTKSWTNLQIKKFLFLKRFRLFLSEIRTSLCPDFGTLLCKKNYHLNFHDSILNFKVCFSYFLSLKYFYHFGHWMNKLDFTVHLFAPHSFFFSSIIFFAESLPLSSLVLLLSSVQMMREKITAKLRMTDREKERIKLKSPVSIATVITRATK